MIVIASTLDPLEIRRRLGRSEWAAPLPFGDDGWIFDGMRGNCRIIVSVAPCDDGVEWVHASISHPDQMPTYGELQMLHRAVLDQRWTWEIHAPADRHINIHPFARHLWARLDGRNMLPDFGRDGSI